MGTASGRTRARLGLLLGAAAGALVGWRAWRRARARQTSPLRDASGVALVTGASSGIGAAYAERLAQEGYGLVLVARREARLRALAEALREQHGVEVEVLRADLARSDDLARVEARLATLPDLRLLVNNAGFGLAGTFAEKDVAGMDAMIRVHVLAAVRLTRAALPMMLAQGRGAIVNVSSLVAFYPMSGSVIYGATKSYLNAFTEALHQELMGTGVRVQALCPGFTRTEFQAAADVSTEGIPDVAWMAPEAVVARSLRDLHNGRVISVPGLGYRILAGLAHWLPRRALYRLGRWVQGQRRVVGAFEGFPKRHYQDVAAFWADFRWMLRHRERVRAAMRQLDPAFRERLMLAVTSVNDCRYCAHHHAQQALADGLTAEEVACLLEGEVDACPPDEAVALLYAQHWAEAAGQPAPEARQRLLEAYGADQAEAIETVLQVIKMGNYAGNTLDYALYRVSGGRWGVREG